MERRKSPPGRSGCYHRTPGNRPKSESVETIVQPCPIAIAACWANIRTFTPGSNIPTHRAPCPNRASSSCASSARGRSRSTPGRARTPRTVTSRNGRGSDGSPRFSASSNVLAIKALTLMPRASAARRTCSASRSSSEIVVRMMQKHNRSSSTHQRRRAEHRLQMIPPWDVIHVSSSTSLWQYRANLSANGRIETVGTRLGV